MDQTLTQPLYIYLGIHGISTIGSIIIFLIRNEHRLTKLEIELSTLKASHDVLTNHGTIPHGG